MPIMNRKLSESERSSVEGYHSKNSIFLAEVMDTRSPKGNGDIKVWVLGTVNDKNKPENWIVAHSINDINTSIVSEKTTNEDSFNGVQTSSGEWKPKPFVGNYVFIFYPQDQSNSNEAYYFGSIQGSQEHTMIPGISYNLSQKDNLEPVCDNEYGQSPVFPPLQTALIRQGLMEDKLRGTSTASTIRDIPSHCWGYLSPLGNSFVVDDGWATGDKNINWVNDPRKNAKDNEGKDDCGEYFTKQNWAASLNENNKNNKLNRFHGGFRFRTRNGTQLLILDSGNIYAINQDGSAWMELSEDGYIDCYSDKGVNVGSRGDINLRTSANINIEAEGTISMKAREYSIEADANVNVKCGSMIVDNQVITKDIEANSGNIGEFSSMNANINGVFSGTLQGTAYFATFTSMTPVNQPMPKIEDLLVQNATITKTKKINQYNEMKIDSITTRCPSHEPWDDHNKNNSIPDLVVNQKKAQVEKPALKIPTQTNQIIKG